VIGAPQLDKERITPMSDNYRRYSAIKAGMLQFFEKAPQIGKHSKYLNMLIAMVSGLGGISHK